MLSSHTPEKVRFYEVLSLLSSCAGLLYISEKVNNSKHFYAFLVLSYRAIYNPAAGCALLWCKKCEDTSPFLWCRKCRYIFYGCRNCRLCAALLRCPKCQVSFKVLEISAYSFRGYKISKCLLWPPITPIPFRV